MAAGQTLKEFIVQWTFGIDKGKLDQLDSNIGQINKKIDETGKNIRKSLGAMREVGSKLTTRLTVPLALFGGFAIKAGADFETSMNRVRALTGGTGSDLKSMSDLAKELGIQTQFSASQAADAMGTLGLAGFNANEILKSTPGVLNLAASAQLSMNQAADIGAKIIRGFSLDASQAGDVADVLVGTFTKANTDLVELGNAFKFAGPVASGFGKDIRETATALALMADAGFSGSLGGTALRGALSKLSDPTAEAKRVIRDLGLTMDQVNPRTRSLEELVRAFSEAGLDAGQALQIMGERAGPAFAALVARGADEFQRFDSMLRGKDNVGKAAAIAAVQMQGFNGAIKELKSAFEGLQIAISESGLMSVGTLFIKALAGMFRWFAKLPKPVLAFATGIGVLLAAIGPLILLLTGAAGLKLSLLAVQFAFGAAASSAWTFIAAMLAAVAPFALFAVAMGLIIEDLVGFFTGKRSFFGDIVGDWIWKNITLPVIKGIEEAIAFVKGAPTAIMNGLRDAWKEAKTVPKSVTSGFRDAFNSAAGFFGFDGNLDGATGATPSSAPAAGAAAGVSGGNSTSANSSVVVNYNATGGAGGSQRDAEMIAKRIREEQERANRDLLNAFPEED